LFSAAGQKLFGSLADQKSSGSADQKLSGSTTTDDSLETNKRARVDLDQEQSHVISSLVATPVPNSVPSNKRPRSDTSCQDIAQPTLAAGADVLSETPVATVFVKPGGHDLKVSSTPASVLSVTQSARKTADSDSDDDDLPLVARFTPPVAKKARLAAAPDTTAHSQGESGLSLLTLFCVHRLAFSLRFCFGSYGLLLEVQCIFESTDGH
jgi:hypothetical protein